MLTSVKNAGKRLYWKSAAVVGRMPFARRLGERVMILDDVFPALLSGFRIAEYNAYLARYPAARVYSTGSSFPLANETGDFASALAKFDSAYPALRGRVRLFTRGTYPAARAIYTIFINNAVTFLPFASSGGVPLVFTLYPGGGFLLDDRSCDEKLRRVFSSKNFRDVIVTQRATHDYLLQRRLCPPEQVHYVFGGVAPPVMLEPPTDPKAWFGRDKRTLDICFVANKYMAGGVDKGYDSFLAIAGALTDRHNEVRFHVVGTFGKADGDTARLGDRIAYYGCLETSALRRFYRRMDAIISPNLPFKLHPGAFDGFPTGCCLEAALSEVAVFCTDELRLNTVFKDREEIAILTRDRAESIETIDRYLRDPAALYQLAAGGQKAFRRVFSAEAQMAPRFSILDKYCK